MDRHIGTPSASLPAAVVGVVAIGRNEGARLLRCLQSARAACQHLVYVDSGSTDGSIAAAQALGAEVVELDRSQPFTAARARNAGFRALLARHPEVACVQFVDGDCELAPAWLDRAAAVLTAEPQLAVVCGRRQERHPDASIYNRLCDLEWVIPAGDVEACGGDAMMRAAALQQVGGFDDAMIAGEEPELCLRLRRQGFRIRSLGEPMTLHDAAMVRFRQWWLRAVRAGHAQAESAARYGRDYPRLRAVRSSLLFGLLVPLTAVVGSAVAAGRGALPLAAVFAALWPASWLLLAVRIFVRERGRRDRAGDALILAASCVLAKLPELQGMAAYAVRRLLHRRPQIIEYKTGGTS